jgi:hypothetical protein
VGVLAILAATGALVAVTTHGLNDQSSSPVAESPPIAQLARSLSPTDVAFIELMIPMNERAMPLLDLLSTASTGGLRDVAAALRATYAAEVDMLRAALAAGGLVEQGLHAGMDMPGYVTQTQLNAVRSGIGRNAAAPDVLCRHLRQSLLVARAEVDAGSDAATRAIATDMVAARVEHVAALSCAAHSMGR